MKQKSMVLVSLVILSLFVVGCSPAQKEGVQQVQFQVVEETTPPVVQEPPAKPDTIAPQQAVPQTKSFTVTAKQFSFDPATITVKKGDTVKLTLKSMDIGHGLSIPKFNFNLKVSGGESKTEEFVASEAGTFSFKCSVQCGSGHGSMRGTLIVEE